MERRNEPDPVVEGPDQLTPDWVTAALRAGGLDVTVTDVRPERVGTGQIGTSYRLHLTYGGDADDAPASVVAKLPGGDAESRQRVSGGYVLEVAFYTTVADTVSIRRPHLWHGAISDDGSSFTLLLEDLCDARPGVQAEGCSVEQARDALRNVAGLHAPRWNDSTLLDYEFVSPPDAATASFTGEVLVGATEEFLTRYDTELDADDKATLRQAAAATAAWQVARPEPFGLVHGDYRLDNLMFPLEGTGVCALDWQTLSIAPPPRDVAYFLGNSLRTDDRRAHEEALVAEYHAELVALGVDGYGLDECWHDYRLGQLQGPMITILGCMYATAERSERADGMFLAMATRCAAAIRDLDPFALL
jgi:hypothetical protein